LCVIHGCIAEILIRSNINLEYDRMIYQKLILKIKLPQQEATYAKENQIVNSQEI